MRYATRDNRAKHGPTRATMEAAILMRAGAERMQPAPTDLTFFTAGYQGHNIETFLDLLVSHGVEQLIDVRQLPFSRKPDFSKKRLTTHLAGVGIAYTHLAALGTPKPLRDEVRREHDFPAFFAAMQ